MQNHCPTVKHGGGGLMILAKTAKAWQWSQTQQQFYNRMKKKRVEVLQWST